MILERLFGIEPPGKRASVKWTGSVLSQDATAKNIWGVGPETTAGVNVTADSALNFSAVYAAVRLLSSIPGSLPKFVYKRVGEDGDKEVDRNHPVFGLLHDRPNPVQTPIQFEETIRSLVLLWGRAVIYIEKDGLGAPVGLWPMHTSQLSHTWSNRRRYYDVSRVKDTDMFPRPPLSKDTLGNDEVLDIASNDGQSVISRAREQIGEGLAAQGFGAGFYGGGAQPYMVLMSKKPLSQTAIDKLRANWQKRHGGTKREIAVLEEEMDLKTVGMPLDDAQFLESRKFYVTEIARWFGVPPHKLADLERATFSNIEEQQLEFYEGLIPWFARFTQEFHFKLFSPKERENYLVDYMVEGLLRGNLAQRYQAYSTALQCGFMNRNEVRRKENLNSMGEDGDIFMVPENMRPADKVDDEPESTDPIEEPNTEDPPTVLPVPPAARAIVLQAVKRLVEKEAAEIAIAARNPAKFTAAAERFYKAWPEKAALAIRPALAGLTLHTDPAAYYVGHCTRAAESLNELAGMCGPCEFSAAVKIHTDRWRAELPNEITTIILGE